MTLDNLELLQVTILQDFADLEGNNS